MTRDTTIVRSRHVLSATKPGKTFRDNALRSGIFLSQPFSVGPLDLAHAERRYQPIEPGFGRLLQPTHFCSSNSSIRRATNRACVSALNDSSNLRETCRDSTGKLKNAAILRSSDSLLSVGSIAM